MLRPRSNRRIAAAEIARRRADRAFRLAFRDDQTHKVPDGPADRDIRDLRERASG